MEEEKNEKKDWRNILNKFNQQIKQVEELPKEPKKTEEVVKEFHSKDFVDIKLEYRRIKIQEQCKKLNSRVVLPSRSSWRDRINGTSDISDIQSQPQNIGSTSKLTSPESERRRNHNWGQRRTKVYHIDSEIDVHKFKVIDTIHIKRSQIEARLAQYNEENKRPRQEPGEVLMLTYPGYEKLYVPPPPPTEPEVDVSTETTPLKCAETVSDDSDDILMDPNLDGLALKDNTKKKLSQFTQHLTDVEKAKKIKSPPLPKKKNYTTHVDWREELRNRDKARQLRELKGFKIGTPDYKEPEKEKEETASPKVEDNKWGKTAEDKWQRLKLKPTVKSQEKIKDKEELKSDDPFKINLKPVTERNKDQAQSQLVSTPKRKNKSKFNFPSKEDNYTAREFEKLSQSPTVKTRNKVKSNFIKEVDESKPINNKDITSKKNEKKKPAELKNNLLNKSKDPSTDFSDDKKYIIKVINFVAIKVAVDKTPPPRRRKSERKKSDEKPPIPKSRPPCLPELEVPEVSVAEECELEDIDQELVQIINSDFEERLKTEIFDEIFIEIIKDNPDFKTAKSRREVVQTCPKPKPKSVYKMKDEKSFDEKYFRPRRKKILDYIPENLPKLNKREDVNIQPMKFSSASENCVTKSLFVGSQYIGQNK